MSDKNLNTALAYYQAMNNKDLGEIAKHLHPAVTLLSPLAEVVGKEAALQAAKGFCSLMKNNDSSAIEWARSSDARF